MSFGRAHMTTVKSRAAEALFPMLSNFHSVGEGSLKAVWELFTQGCLERLILDFGSISLVAVADKDDDSIDLELTSAGDFHNAERVDASQTEPWKSFIGKPFGWGWITVNQQGYCDGLLLSFEGIVPQLVLNVVASSIKVARITGPELGR